MRHRVWTDIGITTFVTAAVVIGTTLGGPLGAGDDPTTPASAQTLAAVLGGPAELGGCTISATVEPKPAEGVLSKLWRRVRGAPAGKALILKLKVTKGALDGAEFPFRLTLERSMTNPLSRVMTQGDSEVIWSIGATALFSSGNTWEKQIEIALPEAKPAATPTPAASPKAPPGLQQMMNYTLSAEHAGTKTWVLSFTEAQLTGQTEAVTSG